MAASYRSNATVAALQIDITEKCVQVDRKPFDVLSRVTETIAHREIVAIVGTSGAGKTTVLRILAGLDIDYGGQVRVFDQPITGPGRDRGLVFQEHRLMPWMTVGQNVAYALPSTRNRKEVRRRVGEALDLVGLTGFDRAWPNQLSGGMAQRASLARALVTTPQILLLDEPLGALDSLLRSQMQAELERVVINQELAAVLVTHDVEEAIILADRVLVMAGPPGRIVGTVDVGLARPRQMDTAAAQELRSELLNLLHADHSTNKLHQPTAQQHTTEGKNDGYSLVHPDPH